MEKCRRVPNATLGLWYINSVFYYPPETISNISVSKLFLPENGQLTFLPRVHLIGVSSISTTSIANVSLQRLQQTLPKGVCNLKT